MHRQYRYLEFEERDHIATITLNRPERRNVLSPEMLNELLEAFAEVASGDALGVILAANGSVFSAGHDFTDMLDQELERVRSLFALCSTVMQSMQAIPQPVIARVHALATGAGCQLVASADLAVASSDASFCTPGGRGGLFCTTPLVAVGRTISRKHALEMGLTGDVFDATTAASWGLVNRVVAPQDLVSATDELMHRVTRGSAASKGIGKRAFYEQMNMDQPNAYLYASEIMATASQHPDAQEQIRAFIEKREARWSSAKASN
ncbi:MAG: enoyl-CoA hydratase-related protein [Acidimicrobiales bacterium]